MIKEKGAQIIQESNKEAIRAEDLNSYDNKSMTGHNMAFESVREFLKVYENNKELYAEQLLEIEKKAITKIVELEKNDNNLAITKSINEFYNIFSNNLVTIYEKCDSAETKSEIALFMKKSIVRWSKMKINYRSLDLFHRGSLIIGRDASNKERKNFNDVALVDAGIDWINKNGEVSTNESLLYSIFFSNTDANYASKELLNMIKSEGSVKKRDFVTKILYRLELGQIGISERGVKYLEKMYDLGELNNPDFFAQRLTAKGDVGVFDDKKVLQKFFNLGDITTQEQVVKPKIHDFVYETLFRNKEGETEEERHEREVYLHEFKENYFDFYDDDFFKETGIRFNNLDFKEQGWFLMHYKESEPEKRKELMDFAREFGENGLKSFLSLEYNDSNGDKILDINKHLDREQVESIFSKYVRIQRIAEDLQSGMKNSEFVNNNFMDANVKNKLRENIYDAFMSRATDILTTAHKIATEGGAKAKFYNGQEIEVNEIDEVVEALEIYEDYLEKMKGFFTESDKYKFGFISSADQNGLNTYNFTVDDKESGEQSFASLGLRSEGTNEHMENFEYDGEARINFLFSPEHISSHIKDKSRREATTFRLDRECLEFDESGDNVIAKDNTRQDGRLSLDFGSIYEDSGQENNTIGRVISVGNFYTSEEKEKKPEFYHNKESFYEDLGDSKVFKGIVGSVEEYIKSRYVKKAKDKMKEAA